MPVKIVKKENVPASFGRKSLYENLPEWQEIKEVLAMGLKPHEAVEVTFLVDAKPATNGSRRSAKAEAIRRAFVLHCKKLNLSYDVVQRVRGEYVHLYISAR